MNKKFLSAVLFGVLMASSTGTFVSCKDYDVIIIVFTRHERSCKSLMSSS